MMVRMVVVVVVMVVVVVVTTNDGEDGGGGGDGAGIVQLSWQLQADEQTLITQLSRPGSRD